MQQLQKGAYPVLPTPFDEAGQIDEPGFRRVLDFAMSSGAQGVVFPGVASEYDVLTVDERLRLIRTVGDQVKNGVAFIVGASATSPEDSIRLAEAGYEKGASATMIMPPAGDGHSTGPIVEFFSAVSDAVPIPIMLQNAPLPAGPNLSLPRIVEVLNACPGVRYVKEETAPYGQRIEAISRQANASLLGVFGGAGGRYVIDELNRGSIGTMPACELVEVHSRLVQAHCDDDLEEARRLFEAILPILNMQSVYRWSLTKEILKRRGLINSTFVRAAGPTLDDKDKGEVHVLLKRIENLIGKLP